MDCTTRSGVVLDPVELQREIERWIGAASAVRELGQKAKLWILTVNVCFHSHLWSLILGSNVDTCSQNDFCWQGGWALP